jgi:hypothetical protein
VGFGCAGAAGLVGSSAGGLDVVVGMDVSIGVDVGVDVGLGVDVDVGVFFTAAGV